MQQLMHKQKSSNPTRNVTPNYPRYKKKGLKKDSSEEPKDHENRISQRSNSKTSKCSLEIFEKRVLNLSKLKNTLNVKKKPEQQKLGKQTITETKRTNSSNKQSQSTNYLERQNIVYVPQKLNNNFMSSRKKSTGSGNLMKPKSKERLSIPKRNEQSLEKQQQRAKLQNTQLLFNLMKHQHIPNYMNKLKIKKQETNNNKKQSTLTTTLVTKTKKNFFSDPSIQLKNEEALQKYELHGELGKGAYGIVRMAVDKASKEKYAVKIYEKSRLDEPNKIKNIERQIVILKKISHPVISKLIETIQTSTQIYLILQYGGANSLYKFLLSKQEHRLSEKQAKTFFKSIIEAVHYLHQNKIVHRDIKAQNILLNRFKNLKLIDFGFSLISRPPQTIDTFCGTPTYMAPQIVSKRDHVALYTDLWSLGILYYVMIQGNYPFRAKNQNELFQKIRRGNYEYIYDDISERSKLLIKSLLNVNPLQRISVEKLLQKEWVDWYNEP